MPKVLRFTKIEELSPTRASVVNGAIMGGPLGAIRSRMLGDKVSCELECMNAALKIMAERMWQRSPG